MKGLDDLFMVTKNFLHNFGHLYRLIQPDTIQSTALIPHWAYTILLQLLHCFIYIYIRQKNIENRLAQKFNFCHMNSKIHSSEKKTNFFRHCVAIANFFEIKLKCVNKKIFKNTCSKYQFDIWFMDHQTCNCKIYLTWWQKMNFMCYEHCTKYNNYVYVYWYISITCILLQVYMCINTIFYYLAASCEKCIINNINVTEKSKYKHLKVQVMAFELLVETYCSFRVYKFLLILSVLYLYTVCILVSYSSTLIQHSYSLTLSSHIFKTSIKSTNL